MLPPHLAKRVIERPEPTDGELVVVWLRVAVRGHDNPALDVGRHLAHALDKPLLVYHAVSERYPHASDRHHAFILQGARDLAEELAGEGLAFASHVERPGHRGPVLRRLAARACAVVTDAMPLDPLRAWTETLAKDVPVWTVDAACLAPMHLLPEAPERAYSFRVAAERLRDPVEWPYPPCDVRVAPYEGPLPFAPVDLANTDLAELIATCAIDHGVAPVADTPGGSRAGYARWAAFRDGPLKRYAWARNDPARPWGVSRLSAYLHYGHVSPFRIARESAERGADKFLDELLVWREMPWHVCFHDREPRGVGRLPAWARQTLDEHAEDPREVLPLEALEEGRTGAVLWDAAQRSLLVHGELHNNLRMTWGKAVLQWSKGPRQALARLYELNDRYALDGRDPASVGGISWCLGAHDRPFSPERPIYGSLRSRRVEDHAERMDVPTYVAHVNRPPAPATRVLVVGAGIAGAAAAWHLARMGVEVEVVDKSRGAGGRMSSRRTDHGRYGHGAPSFTARDPRFLRQVRIWQSAGLVQPFEGRLGRADGGWHADTPRSPRWVVRDKTSALAGHLLAEVPLRASTRVTRLERDGSAWVAHTDAGPIGTWDQVVVTAPAPQARALIGDASPQLAAQLERVAYAPCWAGLVRDAFGLEFDAVRIAGGPLTWMARQDVLPGRGGEERWVVHASPAWSADHLEDAPEAVAEALQQALSELLGREVVRPTVHRWRFARVTEALGVDVLAEDGLVVAGDGLLGPRIEAAWLSGVAAAGRVLRARMG
ncbi:MAG: FAD-dependent oxidoreductase [Deltaproteobacteria bacterium]|nr:MAG: FAD-dependent oxidoreductase [Deltaproteobacteria bacterium]